MVSSEGPPWTLRKELERSDGTDRLIVVVAVQQTQVVLESQLRDEAVDGAPDGEP
jgi:hypothetical protein